MQTILFVCPHGTAKSVIAAAYCQQLAEQRGLPLHAIFAGTDPDPVIAPAVAARLQAEGIQIAPQTPHRATPEELSSAFRILSLGCDPNDLPPGSEVIHWDDVPPASVNLAATCDDIRARVERLVETLTPIL